MFRQFDIDYDKVAIDGVVVLKSVGVSCIVWEAWWNGREVFDLYAALEKEYRSGVDDGKAEGNEDAYDRGYDCGLEAAG